MNASKKAALEAAFFVIIPMDSHTFAGKTDQLMTTLIS
jgi:hypothetical protein